MQSRILISRDKTIPRKISNGCSYYHQRGGARRRQQQQYQQQHQPLSSLVGSMKNQQQQYNMVQVNQRRRLPQSFAVRCTTSGIDRSGRASERQILSSTALSFGGSNGRISPFTASSSSSSSVSSSLLSHSRAPLSSAAPSPMSSPPSSSSITEDDILSLSNASIQQLLEEELRAYDSLKENVSDVQFSLLRQKEKAKAEQQQQQQEHIAAVGGVNEAMSELNNYDAEIDEDHDTTTTAAPPVPLSEQVVNNNMNVRPTMPELLQHFDPLNPPNLNDEHVTLEHVQLWFECAAQQETVSKYEAILSDARSREDYSSISMVQRQLLEWYHPLREVIVRAQKDYISKKMKSTGMYRYGPFLCALQPEKLAIITSHEATMHSLIRSGKSGALSGGSTLMSMALKIGDAVEAEVNVQKLLRERIGSDSLWQSKKDIRKEMEDSDNRKLEEADAVAAAAAEMTTTTTTTEQEATTATESTSESEDPAKEEGKVQDVDHWMYGPTHLQKFIDEMNRLELSRTRRLRIKRANKRAMKLLNSPEPWTTADKVILGAVLIQMLMETARVNLKGNGPGNGSRTSSVPAFTYEKNWVGEHKLVGHIVMNEELYQMMVYEKFGSLDNSTTRHKPMVIPPKEWSSYKDGGYHVLRTDFMRTRGCQIQKNAIRDADLSTVMDGLNVLGRVPWKINREVMEVAQQCWDNDIALGDIPTQQNFELPPQPIRPEGTDRDFKSVEKEEFRIYREALSKFRRTHQKNLDLRSQRGSALLKLNQSQQFKEFEKIYFPYNIDFRGRAYPVPPHLSNIGSDLCRGMLTFAEAKPLGKRGLYWLKVHLANLAGNDKITFDQRAAFTEENMENVRACVEDPFEHRWWMGLDDPFQGLATCHEIVNAIDSGDPESYECSLPVHMDGSCNGLQHYAALGRDTVGGKAVNLCKDDKPQDVYSGVMEEVIRRVAEEAEKMLDIDETREDLSKNEREALRNNRAAKLTNGLIDRGVVKRTVMTSVYGVTYIGAKKQIQEKIEEKLEAKGYDIDEMDNEIYVACGYLARVTMDVMGDLFTGARQTMNWLATCARLISSQGQPVSWISPIGVPVVQPYRQRQPYTVVTLLQTVVLINNNANLPVHKQRQASAFPPNYVHSLDSSHMLLTALEMDRRGLTFSAVHDSFWTHACDVDEMNEVLRESFVELYSGPLLEDLKKTWELQYPSLEFPELPERGDLDLNEVKKAPYFFQ